MMPMLAIGIYWGQMYTHHDPEQDGGDTGKQDRIIGMMKGGSRLEGILCVRANGLHGRIRLLRTAPSSQKYRDLLADLESYVCTAKEQAALPVSLHNYPGSRDGRASDQ